MEITIAEFKTHFPRFTPEYLPVYSSETYFKDNIVYYEGLFYKVKVTSTTNPPTNTTDWELYNDSVLNYTQDSDILNAVAEANVNFNEGLFTNLEAAKLVFMYLVAHYLTIDFRNALGSNQIGIATSRSVGSVSESYSIPNWILNNAGLAPYATTGYGIKYATLIRPYLVGNFFIVKGSINAD
jgi:hypothetical protein